MQSHEKYFEKNTFQYFSWWISLFLFSLHNSNLLNHYYDLRLYSKIFLRVRYTITIWRYFLTITFLLCSNNLLTYISSHLHYIGLFWNCTVDVKSSVPEITLWVQFFQSQWYLIGELDPKRDFEDTNSTFLYTRDIAKTNQVILHRFKDHNRSDYRP